VDRPIERIAILNRGEAATRCLRAIRELRAEEGRELVGIALYTDPDRFAPFVREADNAVRLGAPLRAAGDGEMRPAYLDQERVLAALRAVHADAVWPGWGFLAEDPAFVERLEAAKIVFIGPSSGAMRALGDKLEARRIAEAAGVAAAPWSGGAVSEESVEEAAASIGFPLLIKAVAGGGGRGIRRVDAPGSLVEAFRSASSEAAHAFGDRRVFLESFVPEARHVEVQLIGDRHGRVLAVGVRDCSVQRRHQKVIEEGPPPDVSETLLDEVREASVAVLRKVGYVGAATCEFLLGPDGRAAFLEVNPRLQVEHGVTEALTGFDLVKWQIRVARGDALPPDVPAERGHAIEARVCAEDPAAAFAPAPGRIALLEIPSGPGVRVDAGVAFRGVVPAEFDSMIAKVIAHGETREEARARLERALGELHVVIEGGTTNRGFLLDVLGHADFREASCHTGWLEQVALAREPDPIPEALLVGAILTYQRQREALLLNFYVEASRGRPRNVPPSRGTDIDLVYSGVPYRLRVFAIGGWSYRVSLGDRVSQVTLLEQGPHQRQLVLGDRRLAVVFSEEDLVLRLEIEGRTHRLLRDLGGKVRAPAPALVIEVLVAPGDRVREGERLGLLEAMKSETAFYSPLAGTVREVCVRPGARVVAGEVILVIEPASSDERLPDTVPSRAPLELPEEEDPLETLFGPDGANPDLGRASACAPVQRAAACAALRTETRRILMGYDVNPERAEALLAALNAPVEGLTSQFRAELASLARSVELFGDIEWLFSRTPTRPSVDALGPSNDARMAMYLRRIDAEGAGIAPDFLAGLRRALAHYDIDSLAPDPALQRALLRLYATRTTKELRDSLVTALLGLLIRLAEEGAAAFARYTELQTALDRLALLRETVAPGIADLALQAHFLIFERSEEDRIPIAAAPGQVRFTLVPPPSRDPRTAAQAAELGLTDDEAERLELWRLSGFDLERIETRAPGVWAFFARARAQPGDERLLCFAEIHDLGPEAPSQPDLSRFERRFHEAIEAMRHMEHARDPARRLHWNRLTLFVRPPVVVPDALREQALRRLAPETGHLGAHVDAERTEHDFERHPPEMIEVVTSNPTGSRVEVEIRAPHDQTLAAATPYERRVAAARARGLVYPYEVIRLFTSTREDRDVSGLSRPSGPGGFVEYDLVAGTLQPIDRPPGGSTCGVVVGVISTPTPKYPEGMRRVLILNDPTRGLGALAAPECDRIGAAIDLAAREDIPVEWVSVSSGALISMESGTENLDATARVARKLVEFTDAGGEVNIIIPGVNVGAQSYFDALATMGLHTRGILIMLPRSSMVLTGRTALEFSGGVTAEDEVGIGGYERIMGPSGQAHHQARDLAEAYALLLDHYACTYRAPGESGPRRFATADPADRDLTLEPYEGEEGFRTLGELFASDTNPERKRNFSMRSLMRALVDRDGGYVELWRDWIGAETAIVWNTHIGGFPALLVGMESRPSARIGYIPNDGPDSWTAGTLFPHSSREVARALNAASGRRPAVILANLSGFDGSPESMRRGILEYGAEIARAVVRFQGPILFVVVSRYHGGAYVVFSRALQDRMKAVALSGSYASVIGGPAAAAVVFPRTVRARASADPRVEAARVEVERATGPAERATRRAYLDRVLEEVILEKQAEVAAEFDAVHTVERAQRVGSVEEILEPSDLRPRVIDWLEEST
jgi:acetyl/propionyl-CoA carboxylase alpha subunit/acetyl-CoA carboxylase carboxyltransferase component